MKCKCACWGANTKKEPSGTLSYISVNAQSSRLVKRRLIIEVVESSILSSSTIYLGLAVIYPESVIDQLIYLRIPQTQV